MGWLEVGYSLDAFCDSYVAKLTAVNHLSTGFCSISAEVLGWDFLVGQKAGGSESLQALRLEVVAEKRPKIGESD